MFSGQGSKKNKSWNSCSFPLSFDVLSVLSKNNTLIQPLFVCFEGCKGSYFGFILGGFSTICLKLTIHTLMHLFLRFLIISKYMGLAENTLGKI